MFWIGIIMRYKCDQVINFGFVMEVFSSYLHMMILKTQALGHFWVVMITTYIYWNNYHIHIDSNAHLHLNTYTKVDEHVLNTMIFFRYM